MSETLIGDNSGDVILHPVKLAERLELEHVELFDRAMALDAAGLKLPLEPQTDEESGALSDHVVALRSLAADAERARVEVGRPYLEGQRVTNATFAQIKEPCETGMKEFTRRVDAYRKAKEARERRQREIAEQAERARAAEAQRLADEAAAAARKSQEEADAAAAALKTAKTPEELAAAEQSLRDAEADASAQRRAAERHTEEVGQAEHAADANARAAAAPALGTLSTGGASSGGSRRWVGRITDREKVLASLGPLGKWISNDAITQAIAAAVRDGVRDTKEAPAFAGVSINHEEHTVIRSARKPKD
jgi:hypothetical protein